MSSFTVRSSERGYYAGDADMGCKPHLHSRVVAVGSKNMSVILRHAPSGFYYGGREFWVNGPALAFDLGTIEGASDAAKEEDFGGLEIVVSFGDPDCELVLPLRRTGRSRGNAAPVRAQCLRARSPRISLGQPPHCYPHCVRLG